MKHNYKLPPAMRLFLVALILLSLSARAQTPQAGFTASVLQGCAPLSVNFTNTSSGAASFQWNFGNGNFSTLVNPQNVFVQPGTYTVMLTATSAGGQTNTHSVNITALPGPQASFSAASLSGCAQQSTLSFTNTSQGAVGAFWDFGDGTSSNQLSPQKVFNTPGTYSVSLMATNQAGCQSVYTLPQSINIYPLPDADFSVNTNTSCNLNQSFNFTNLSTGATSAFWDFGDGTTSNQLNPSKIYGAPGTYSVKLRVTSSNGCLDSLVRNNYITIHAPVSPQIAANDSAGCEPFAVNFTQNVSNAASYSWNFGNGMTSSNAAASVNYPTAGTFPVSLTVTMSNGCSYTASQLPIAVFPKPIPQFTLSNTNGCAPLTVTLNNQSQGGSNYIVNWGLGVAEPLVQNSFTYTQPGLYSVALGAFSPQGCYAVLNQPAAVQVVAPVAAFVSSDTVGCPPLNVTFSNTSTNASSYLWNFGNGQTSTQANPTVTYNQLGTYDVQLIATGPGGCTDTLLLNDYINVSYQQATYTPPPPITGCVPLTSSFSVSGVSGTTYTWDFGDGTTATGSNVNHAYTQNGVYTVSLMVNDGTACSTFYPNYQTVIVEGGTPYFAVNVDPCPPYTVSFEDTASVNTVSWLWNFGDGTSSTEESPNHIYPNQHVHHVSLTTLSQSGCMGSYIAFNAVNFAASVASFTSSYTQGPYPLTVSFTPTNPAATSWFWDFGDGNTSTEQFPVHVYQTEGDYQVTLTITTDDCSITSVAPATADEVAADVEEGEEASGGTEPEPGALLVEPLTGCAPLTVNFYPQDSTHNVMQWHFGDGTISTQQRPAHTYTETGTFNVFYTAITPYGPDTFMYAQSIFIGGGLPTYTINQQGDCAQLDVQLNLQNADFYETIQWNFSDGDQASTASVSHSFLEGNSANTVMLTVVDTLGCTSTSFNSIQIMPVLPFITFPATACNTPVTFQNNMANAPGYSFFWNFGDGQTSNLPSPTHTFQGEGNFSVQLTVTSPGGCEVTFPLSHSILVASPQIAFNLNGPDEGCAPLTTTFANTTPNVGTIAWFWSDGTWSLGGWSGSAYSLPIDKTFPNPGVYSVIQRVTSSLIPTCVVQVNHDSVVVVHGADADFSFIQSGLCIPITAQFTSLANDAVSWNWDFGNGITSTEQDPTITFIAEPADSITLTITNVHGCTASVTKPHIDLLNPQITATFQGNCNPLPVQFSTPSQGMIAWEWAFGDGATASGATVNHVYTQNGSYTATLIVTTAENCRDTVSMQVPIDVDGPVAGFSSPTPAGCAPSIVEFFDESQDAVAWLWSFGDGTSSTVQHPVKLYDMPGVYDVSLIVTNAAGCNDTLLLADYITVLGPATSFTFQSSGTCVGAPIQFTDLSFEAVEWEWNFGEGSTSTEQNPSFVYNTPGNYVITLFSKDTLGCSAFYTIPAPIQIHPYPVAGFTVDNSTGCAPHAVNFTNTSTGATSYQWDFGQQGASTATDPSFVFSNPGTYTVSMVATTAFGCSDTTVFDGIRAHLVPVAAFTLSGTEGCTPLSVTFSNDSWQLENPQYTWDFGNGESSSEVNPTQVYFNPGFYSVSLTVTNGNGCADTLVLPSIVNVFDTLAAPVTPILRVSVINTISTIVEWEESTAPDFGAYELFRKNQDQVTWSLIATITDAHILSYIDQGLNTLDEVYCYKLLTRDRCGYSVETDSLIEHCTINVEVITRENNTIDVSWTPYIGKTTSQYRIFRTEENTNIEEDLGTVPGDVLTYIDSSIYCPVKYRYDIRAEGLNGQWHVESESDYDFSAPIANLFANQQVNTARSTVVNDEFVLTEWLAPEIMADKVSGYLLFRSVDEQNWELIATLPAFQTSYTDESVQVQTTKYYYRVMATNRCGLLGIQGGSSDNIVLETKALDDLYIEILWTPYKGWGPHGVGFYMVERETSDGSWEVIRTVPGSEHRTVDEN